MAYLLFHGRHITHTAFQERYLWEILNTPIGKLDLIGETNIDPHEKITHVIFAVTSANKSNSRFNPLPFHLRAIAIDRFFLDYRRTIGAEASIVGIPHFDPTDRYVDILIKEIHEAEGINITPENTIVVSSTPPIIELYRENNFAVLTAEFDYEHKEMTQPTPIDVVQKLAKTGNWKSDAELQEILAKSTRELWHDYPAIPATIQEIWHEPLLTESGSLTETRDYSSYAFGMAHAVLLDLKYRDIKDAILPGRIADEGCADGALLTKISKDFPDSDLIGVEIASEFLARCHERLRAGEFGGAFVFFHQRNLMNPIFEDNSIDTTICNSTTHEIWSYGNGLPSLSTYIALKYKQLKKGGRLVIRDVIGPENKESEVYMKLNSKDGANENIFLTPDSAEAMCDHIKGLSTEARFYRFAEDYLADMRAKGHLNESSKITFREEIFNGEKYFVLRLKDAVEFMSRKDYADNWESEMNEEFAFFSFADWKELLKNTGFAIIENPNEPTASSRIYKNEWVVENRLKGSVELFKKENDTLMPLEYPPTNVILIAEK